MEISQFRGFSELSGMEEPLFNSQWVFDDHLQHSMNMDTAAAAFVDQLYYDHHPPMFLEPSPRPSKQLKSTCSSSWNSSIITQGVVSSKTTPNYAAAKSTPHDHILAERKRREKISQRFIALSALVPGLKKMDKASVLGDAIKYLKSLQEKVKQLEEQTKKKPNVESVFVVKRHEAGGGPSYEQLPEVEARICGKDVLVRVHCEKKGSGIVEETLAQIEKHHLSVINTTAMAFGTCALDITVVAQMDQECTVTMKDLVNNLRTGLKRFM